MMRITNKIIEGVVSEVAGEEVIPLVKYLKDKKNISEFKIAQVLKSEVNATRNMLYRLYHSNLVSFIRKKDKKKGWYIYYWTFNTKSVGFLMSSLRKKRLENLRERLKRENNGNFYVCPDQCMRLDFEQASNFEFKCLECGKLLEYDNNQGTIEDIQKEISNLEKEARIVVEKNVPQRNNSKKLKKPRKKKQTKKIKKAKKPISPKRKKK
ncbi:MAG: hypothetical protein QF824_03885 [Candidatus Woesearchaeota archaeon]|nr:hypothetical protein [Candidatus Woesearchaeota archaeon]MDP7457790.1 hypothetical protein [Candidatus Woesearchaeota archaeon]